MLFVVDTTVGVTEEDSRVADLLRRVDTPGAAWSPTRSTTPTARPPIWEFCRLGLGDPGR